jgi:hypothetical protein
MEFKSMTISALPVGMKVKSTITGDALGTIVGHCVLNESNEARLVYIVKLVGGVWDEKCSMFITNIVCDASSVEPIVSEDEEEYE